MSGAGHAKSIDYTNLLITPLSSEIGAGENWACGITLANGGTPWAGPADGSTGGPFNISAGMITNQNISSGGTTATLYGQAPNYPAVITITDTVNSITGTINVIPVITPRSGAINIYVGYGGIPDVPAPIVLASIGPGDIENYGDRIYQYQIIVHCNGGTSSGDVGIAEGDSGYTPFNNIGVDASVPTSDGSTTFFSPLAGDRSPGSVFLIPLGKRITTIYNSAQPFSDFPVSINWQAHPSATSFDVLRQELYQTGGGNSGWQLLANVVGNTFSDINGPTSDYVIPSTNTTANSAYANDVYDGLTQATAKATLAAARAVAATMPGSQIVINGLIAETSNVPFVNNVTHVGFSGDNTVDLVKYYGESSSSATAIQLGNGCDYINIGFETDLDDQIVVGSNPDDPANDDVRLFNCRIEGWMNALRVQPSGGTSCIKAYRTTFRSAHGTCGMLAPCSLYFSDCIFSATNSPFLQGKGTLAIQWAEGHACLRDTDVESTIDSQSPTSVAITVEGTQYPWTSAAISAAEVSGSRSIVLINSRLFGTTADLILFGVLNGTGDNKTTGWWAYNSPLSKAKNASAILTLRSLYLEFNNGVYQRNPAVIVPCAS